jgi:hypothetical protein
MTRSLWTRWAIAAAGALASTAGASAPPVLSPEPYAHACLDFPESILGTRAIGDFPTFLPGRWLNAPLAPADFDRMARLLEGKASLIYPNSTDPQAAAVAELYAATLHNLRTRLPIAELARRQRLDYRAALRLLHTPLSAPAGGLAYSMYGDILDTIGTVTWLLTLKESEAGQRPGMELFLDLLEPLETITGMGLVEAIDYLHDPLRPLVLEDDLAFSLRTLGRPNGWKTELLVTRALLISLDRVRASQAAQSTLFRRLDVAVGQYFSDPGLPRVAADFRSPRPMEETERLLDRHLFLGAYRSGLLEGSWSEPNPALTPLCR